MQSTMRQSPLGIPLLVRHIERVTARSRVHTPERPEGMTFATLAERAGRLASALKALGLRAGDVVGTLCAATSEHLEAYLAVPGVGFVLHTVNARLHDDQLIHVLRHADDRMLIADIAHAERLQRVLPECPNIETLVLVGADATPGYSRIPVHRYEDLLMATEPYREWADIDEDAAAIICYTGGTTGMPKGVAYSHRALWLQAMSLCTANSLAIGSSTRLLPAVPLYHVNGWGLPFAALMAGAELILPGQSLHADDLLDLIERHQPNLAAGVPTIWSDVLAALRRRHAGTLGALEAISCGGSQVPSTLAADYAVLGVDMFQAWGMTETASMSAICRIPAWATDENERERYRATQGRIVCGLEVRIVEQDGQASPGQGAAIGEIQIRGPWVTGSYMGAQATDSFDQGWLRTGDLGTVDDDGYISIADRTKDAIKSGGEWISSLELEQAIRTHPAVSDVAVVAVADSRWQERPAALVVFKQRVAVPSIELSQWLKERVARWWIPDLWLMAPELPRTSVGKIDKKHIRELVARGEYPRC